MLEVSFTGWGNCWYVRIPGIHIQKTNIIRCDEEVTGIFRIEPKDEAEYLRTKSFAHIKKLRPCLSPGSTFSKLVAEGKIPKIDAEYCFFEIKQYREVYAPIPRKNIEVEVPNVFKIIEPEKPAASVQINTGNGRQNYERSKDLRTLILASEQFWANADRDDKTTWHNNSEVEEWLKERGFSDRLANTGATIIRPEWAVSGRKPKE